MLYRLKNNNALLWMCAEDFNKIILDTKKLRGTLRLEWQMENFKKALEEYELAEVKTFIARFTWTMGKGTETILEKLDKGLVISTLFSKDPCGLSFGPCTYVVYNQ